MQDSTRRTLRTTVQTVLALAAALPGLVTASGALETLPWLGGAVVVAAAVTRFMAAPALQPWLPAWLRTSGTGR